MRPVNEAVLVTIVLDYEPPPFDGEEFHGARLVPGVCVLGSSKSVIVPVLFMACVRLIAPVMASIFGISGKSRTEG